MEQEVNEAAKQPGEQASEKQSGESVNAESSHRPDEKAGTEGGSETFKSSGFAFPVLFKQWKFIIMHPVQFTSSLPAAKEDLKYSLLFAFVCATISAVFGSLFSGQLRFLAGNWLATVCNVYAMGVACHFIAQKFGGKGSLPATVRAACYSYAPAVLTCIPIVGAVAGIYVIALFVMGLSKTENLSTGKSALIVIPTVLVLGLAIGLLFAQVETVSANHAGVGG